MTKGKRIKGEKEEKKRKKGLKGREKKIFSNFYGTNGMGKKYHFWGKYIQEKEGMVGK